MRQRKSYSADMKAKIALEAVKGQRTVQEIATHYGVHPSQVAQWKRQVVENLPEIFQDGRGKDHQKKNQAMNRFRKERANRFQNQSAADEKEGDPGTVKKTGAGLKPQT